MLKVVNDLSDIPAFFTWLADKDIISLDIETTGLNPRQNHVIGFSVSDGVDAFYFVHLRYNETTQELDKILPWLSCKQVMEKLAAKRLLGYNFSFDSRFIHHYFSVNVIDSLYADVMLLTHTCNENLMNYGLKAVSALVFGSDAASEQADLLADLKTKGASKGEMYKANFDILAKYALQDALLTHKLYQYWNPKLTADGLDDFFYKDEVMPLYKTVTIPMELRGIPVKVSYLQQSSEEINVNISRLIDEIQAAIAPNLSLFNEWYLNKDYPASAKNDSFVQMWAKIKPGQIQLDDSQRTLRMKKWELEYTDTGKLVLNAKQLTRLLDSPFKRFVQGFSDAKPHPEFAKQIQQALLAQDGIKYPFNIGSKDHLKRLFFTALKETPVSRTDKGSPQVDDEFLDIMAKKYEWCAKLRTFNKLVKIRGTYIEQYLESQENGIYYPSFFQHRTVSGRYSSPTQQLPRPMVEGAEAPEVVDFTNRIRHFFNAGDGHKLIGADYESLEPKVFAHVSTDKRLQDIFVRGDDFYSTIAIATEGLTEYSADKTAENYLGKVAKQIRQTAKAYSLGIPYGLTPYKLKYELNISESEASAKVNGYLAAYPDLTAWMKRSEALAMKDRQIRSEVGRIRRFPAIQELADMDGFNLDSLELWKNCVIGKTWDSAEGKYIYDLNNYKYTKLKEARSTVKNYLNNAKNFQIQSLAASIVNRAAIAMAKQFTACNTPAYICMQIHDELVIRCDEAYVSEVSAVVQHCMEETYKITVPLTAQPQVGYAYGETK